MASDDWIQESLARLEGLEAQRTSTEAALENATDTDELRALSQQLEQLEADIASLYEALEAAAEEGDDDDGGGAPEDDIDSAPTGLFSREDLTAMAAAQGAPPLPTSVPQPGEEQMPPPQQPAAAPQQQQDFGAPQQQQGFGAPQQQQGFGAPQQQQGFGAPQQQQGFGAPQQQQGFGAPPQQQGFGAPPQQQGFGAPPQQQGFGAPQQTFGASYEGDLDDDLKPKSKGPLIGIILVVLAAAGVGGYFALGGGGSDAVEPDSPSGPAKVIKAGEIPPDTQGPKGAKGANVDSVEGSQFKEGSSRPSGGTRPSGGGSTKTKKKKPDDKTKIVETDDPLAGIDGR